PRQRLRHRARRPRPPPTLAPCPGHAEDGSDRAVHPDAGPVLRRPRPLAEPARDARRPPPRARGRLDARARITRCARRSRGGPRVRQPGRSWPVVSTAKVAGTVDGAPSPVPATAERFRSRTLMALSRYQRFTRAEWARLRADTPLTLTEEDLIRLRGLNDWVSLDEVVEIYLPLSRL